MLNVLSRAQYDVIISSQMIHIWMRIKFTVFDESNDRVRGPCIFGPRDANLFAGIRTHLNDCGWANCLNAKLTQTHTLWVQRKHLLTEDTTGRSALPFSQHPCTFPSQAIPIHPKVHVTATALECWQSNAEAPLLSRIIYSAQKLFLMPLYASENIFIIIAMLYYLRISVNYYSGENGRIVKIKFSNLLLLGEELMLAACH